MNNIIFLLDRLYQLEKIPLLIREQSTNRIVFSKGYELEKDRLNQDNKLIELMTNLVEEKPYPILKIKEDKHLYGVCKDMDNNICVLGPTFIDNISKMSTLLSLVHKEITGEMLTEQEVINRNIITKEDQQVFENELTHYMFHNAENDILHHKYTDEVAINHLRINGYNIGFKKNLNTYVLKELDRVQKSQKQSEYFTVISITLTTRHAIEAGLKPTTAYAISDLLLDKLEKCKTHVDILKLKHTVHTYFDDAIKKEKDQKSGSVHVEQCKEYISRNFSKPIKLKDIAKSISINSSYLSRHFSEIEKTTIREYINKKRIEAACNMLKYSDTSISDIASNLSFNTQSHFGSVFKSYIGVTPNKYRNNMKIIDIKEVNNKTNIK